MSGITPKQEAFCQRYIETGNASEAYRQSYDAIGMKPETINRKAKELLDHGKITARLTELQADHRRRHDVTVDSLTAELEAARQLAMAEKTPAAMVSATMGKAKLHGLLIDKPEVKIEEKPNREITLREAARRIGFLLLSQQDDADVKVIEN